MPESCRNLRIYTSRHYYPFDTMLELSCGRRARKYLLNPRQLIVYKSLLRQLSNTQNSTAFGVPLRTLRFANDSVMASSHILIENSSQDSSEGDIHFLIQGYVTPWQLNNRSVWDMRTDSHENTYIT